MPDDLPIPDICLRFRCSRCGSKNLTSRMSIREVYEVLEARQIRKGTEPGENG